MSKVRFSCFLVLLIFFLSSCSAIPASPKVVSISGEIELPLLLESNKYWVDGGPLFVVSKNPLVTYRVIDRDELNLSGSDNAAYEFMASAFLNPEGSFENSFLDSHKEYELIHKEERGLDFYILEKENESKVYIVAHSVAYCLEVAVIGSDAHLILSDIIDEVRLTKGE